MAIRRRQIQPDQMLALRTGEELAVVSDEAFLTALVDVGRMVCFAGGAMSAIVHRAPTDLEGEMVTVGAVLEWKDRTDARAQPEPAAQRVADPAEFNDYDRVVNTRTGEELRVEATPEDYAEEARELQEREPALVGAYTLPFQRAEEVADPTEPPAGLTDEGIEDGIVVDPDAEDDSDIPESMR